MPDTQKLTIKDINCGNCNNKNTEKCPLYHEMMSTERKKPWNWWVPTGSDVIMAVTETVGCASHPLALQVLAAPSITELEKKKSLTHTRMNANLDLGNDGNWQGGKKRDLKKQSNF